MSIALVTPTVETAAATSGIEAVHPSYTRRIASWTRMFDANEGEDWVRQQGDRYLPATSGHRADGYGSADGNSVGNVGYRAYAARAIFPDFVPDAVRTLAGIMSRKPATIRVPKALEPMLERATPEGESIFAVLRKINEAQLLYGRYGLLLDVANGAPLPYIAQYSAVTIRNWDTGIRQQGMRELEMLVLDETSPVRRNGRLEWEMDQRYRLITLDGAPLGLGEGLARGTYQSAVVRPGDALAKAQFTPPSVGGRTLDRIPFVFINASDLVPQTDLPPLLGLADLCYAIYRLEADYRHTLHMQGQDTLTLLDGLSPEEAQTQRTLVGAGAVLHLPLDGDAKYIGVSSAGLSEQREALQNDRATAGQMSGRLLDNRTREAESGDALRTRLTARTASLSLMSRVSALALKDVLRAAAEWMGANPDEVSVEANVDFADDAEAADELNTLMDAKVKGLPLSRRSLHALAQRREYTTLTFEEELKELDKERMELGQDGEATSDIDPDQEDEDDHSEEPDDGERDTEDEL